MAANRPGEQDVAWLLNRAAHQVNQRLCQPWQPRADLGQSWTLQRLSDGTGRGMSEAAAYALVPAPTLTKAVDQLLGPSMTSRRW